MKVKIVGFKVGKSRPTANRTLDNIVENNEFDKDVVGEQVMAVLAKSDFVSIRRVND